MTHVRPVNRQTFSYTPITQASYIAQKALAITFCKYLSAGVRILKTTPVPFSGTCPILFLSEVMFSSPWARLCSTDLVDWPFAVQNFAMAMWGCSFGCTVHIFIFPCCCETTGASGITRIEASKIKGSLATSLPGEGCILHIPRTMRPPPHHYTPWRKHCSVVGCVLIT